MFNRRREDRVLEEPPAPAGAELPRIAVHWLQDLLRTEFADAAFSAGAPGAGDDDDAARLAVWRREWRRRWRRLQLPEQLAAFTEAMEGARGPEEVHGIFREHARDIVGAYACLLFLPAPDGRLHPLPDRYVADLEDLSLAAAGREPKLLAADDVRNDEHAALAPLFGRARAVALAVAPYADGMAVLVERRGEREFESVDWQLLRTLCAQAEASLGRGTLLAGGEADPRPDAAAGERLDRVLRHAWAGAALGHLITLVLVCVEAEEDPDAAVRHAAAVLRREARGGGPVLHHGERGLLLVLNADADGARVLVNRAGVHTLGRATLHAAVAPVDPATGPARELLHRLESTLA
ncbi:MAG TPA: hypothetical protein VHG93_26005 [Longimicrobium sp.]|nr:hypothetical protein [Longimicrobium sp.]